MFWERGPCSGVSGEELPENVSLCLCEVPVQGSQGGPGIVCTCSCNAPSQRFPYSWIIYKLQLFVLK